MKDQYEKIAQSYDTQLRDTLTSRMYKEWRQELRLAIKKHGIKVKTLVDLGCGTGVTTLPWVKNRREVIGVELSKKMLDEAKKKSSKVKWVCQDIVHLNIGVKADVVTCHFDVLNHILKKRDLQKTFCNVYDIMNLGGIFIFDIMSPESFEWLKRKNIASRIVERPYLKEEVKVMLKKAGFKILRVWKQQAPEWDFKPRRLLFLVQR